MIPTLLKQTDKYVMLGKNERLDMLKQYLSLMYPLYDFGAITAFEVIYSRDKIQFYIGDECVCAIHQTGKYVSELIVYKDKAFDVEVCLNTSYTSIVKSIIDIENNL